MLISRVFQFVIYDIRATRGVYTLCRQAFMFCIRPVLFTLFTLFTLPKQTKLTNRQTLA